MERIVDITTDQQHLSALRGFLKVEHKGAEVGRVPLDDIAAVIVHGHGITYSNNLLVALAKRNALLVTCGANHTPAGLFWPLSGHHLQGGRMRAQWQASKPLQKRLWQQLVQAKIRMQAAVLTGFGQPYGALEALASKVRSGDPENIEAQAARRYWPLLMGKTFRRDRAEPGVNSLLNYGYTVLRASTARAIVAAGLHPTIGLGHSNRANDLALADDLMEPFRPIVDVAARALSEGGVTSVTKEAKVIFAGLTALDLTMTQGESPVFMGLQRLATSLAKSFEAGRSGLDLPAPLAPERLEAIRRLTAETADQA